MMRWTKEKEKRVIEVAEQHKGGVGRVASVLREEFGFETSHLLEREITDHFTQCRLEAEWLAGMIADGRIVEALVEVNRKYHKIVSLDRYLRRAFKWRGMDDLLSDEMMAKRFKTEIQDPGFEDDIGGGTFLLIDKE